MPYAQPLSKTLLQLRLPDNFHPYREFFTQQCVARIVQSRPQFRPKLIGRARDNLRPDRQTMYLRGVLDNDFCEEELQEHLSSQPKEADDIHLGWLTAVKKGVVYWCDEGKLMSLKLQKVLQREGSEWQAKMGEGQVILDLHEIILDLKIIEDIIYLRTARTIVTINENHQILHQYLSNQQIMPFSEYNSKLTICKYSAGVTLIQEISGNQAKEIRKIEGRVTAHWKITQNDLIYCTEDAISILDCRVQAIQLLHKRQNPHKNRIFSAISLENGFWSPRYLATCESFATSIYDIRKCSSPVRSFKHYSQQNPPYLMQLYSGNQQSSLSLENPIEYMSSLKDSLPSAEFPLLLACNPHSRGSSMFAELSLEGVETEGRLSRQFRGQNNSYAFRYQLLYDAGKLHNGYNPRSFAAFPLQSRTAFVHLDNFQGLSLEMFEPKEGPYGWKQRNTKTNIHSFIRSDFTRQEPAELLCDPNQQWFLHHTLKKHLEREQKDYWSQMLEEDNELALQEDQTSKRLIRYADLSQFYHRLHQVSPQLVSQKPNPPQASTQPSQSYKINWPLRIRQGCLREQDLQELAASWDQ